MTILSWIFLIWAMIASALDVGLFVTGVQFNTTQNQTVNNYNMNVNENQNLNLVNDQVYFSNATVIADLGGGRTNLDFIIPIKMTNYQMKFTEIWAVTNHSNYTKIGLFPRK